MGKPSMKHPHQCSTKYLIRRGTALQWWEVVDVQEIASPFGLISLANIAVLMLSPEGPLHDSAPHFLTVYNPILREKLPHPTVLETYCRSYC